MKIKKHVHIEVALDIGHTGHMKRKEVVKGFIIQVTYSGRMEAEFS